MNDAVHASHCCKWHGCKYGDPDCPVKNGRIKQLYLCEECTDLLNDELYYKNLLNQASEIRKFKETELNSPEKDFIGKLYIPKTIATIRVCGNGMVIPITEEVDFKIPTENQRKNLRELLCIEVDLEDN